MDLREILFAQFPAFFLLSLLFLIAHLRVRKHSAVKSVLWVLLFGAIALGGLIVMISYAVWLWHKASDLFSELQMLGKRAEELAALVSQVQLPDH